MNFADISYATDNTFEEASVNLPQSQKISESLLIAVYVPIIGFYII